jgi:hypothetical protein
VPISVPSFGLAMTSLREPFSSRFKLAASLAGRRLALAMAGDHLLSVSAYWPKHLSLFSPTGDPSKPGTGTTLLTHGDADDHPVMFRPPGPVLDATKPSFHPIPLLFAPGHKTRYTSSAW